VRLLEIMDAGSEVVRTVHEEQRERLQEEHDHYLLEHKGVSVQGRARALASVRTPNMILLRGLRTLPEVTKAFPRIPILVDSCELTPSWGRKGLHLTKNVKAVCYSENAQKALIRLGLRAQVLCGPVLRQREDADALLSKPVRVGILPGPGDRAALQSLLTVSRRQEWGLEVLTLLPSTKATTVDSVWELASEVDILVGPHEAEDCGGPSDAAILALAYGRGLVVPRLASIDALPFAAGGVQYADKYVAGSYAGAVRRYMENPTRWENWVLGLSYPSTGLCDILST